MIKYVKNRNKKIVKIKVFSFFFNKNMINYCQGIKNRKWRKQK